MDRRMLGELGKEVEGVEHVDILPEVLRTRGVEKAGP